MVDPKKISRGEGEGLSDHQYGFRKGKSTVQAIEAVMRMKEEARGKWCVLITLDVRNAFNMATWSIVMKELSRRGISQYLMRVIGQYFRDRWIKISKEEKLEVTAGVPQGSVLGPTLWNILYDGVLRLELPTGSKSIGYADDLAIVVSAEDEDELVFRANEALSRIDVWISQNQLELAPEKTEAVIMKRPRNRREIRFLLKETIIVPGRTVRYLGVMIGDKSTFGEHVKTVTKKAEQRVSALSRIMPNVGGPRSSKRQMMCGVVHSIMLYAAPIWHGILKQRRYRQIMERTQRKILVRGICAYRTVSAKAAQVIAGIAPVELLAQERKYLYDTVEGHASERKIEAREITIMEWQRNWDENDKVAQWTKKLIPVLEPWVHCKYRTTDYFLTQFLSGHGSYRSYTKRMGKTNDDICIYCGKTDTPAHTILACQRWEDIRNETNEVVGVTLSAENIISQMIESDEKWKKIHKMIRQIMICKETEEWRHKGARTPDHLGRDGGET